MCCVTKIKTPPLSLRHACYMIKESCKNLTVANRIGGEGEGVVVPSVRTIELYRGNKVNRHREEGSTAVD